MAERDIRVAKKIMAEDWDWAFSITYNAILQAARALVFYKGYRPTSGEGGHVAVIRFAEITLGEDFRDEISLFDRMRLTRHKVIYDVAGIISEHEAKQAFEFAQRLIKIIKEHIEKDLEEETKENG